MPSRIRQPERNPNRSMFAVTLLLASLLVHSAVAAEDDVPASAAPERHGSIFADPAGLLLFGPRIGIEAGSGPITGAVYGRWLDAGWLARSMFLGTGDKFAFSYGLGARGRYYFSDGEAGANLGLAVEYLHTRIENDVDRTATISQYLVPYVEGGYRVGLGQFYAGLAAGVGYAFRLSGTVENLPGGSAANRYEANNESTFYATGSLEIGVYF